MCHSLLLCFLIAFFFFFFLRSLLDELDELLLDDVFCVAVFSSFIVRCFLVPVLRQSVMQNLRMRKHLSDHNAIYPSTITTYSGISASHPKEMRPSNPTCTRFWLRCATGNPCDSAEHTHTQIMVMPLFSDHNLMMATSSIHSMAHASIASPKLA